MNNNELLSSISGMMDEKLIPIREDIKILDTKIETLEQRTDNRFIDFEQRIDNRFIDFEQRTDNRFKAIELLLENEIIPTLNLLVENCVPAALDFRSATERIDNIEQDVDALKRVVSDHSATLNEIA